MSARNGAISRTDCVRNTRVCRTVFERIQIALRFPYGKGFYPLPDLSSSIFCGLWENFFRVWVQLVEFESRTAPELKADVPVVHDRDDVEVEISRVEPVDERQGREAAEEDRDGLGRGDAVDEAPAVQRGPGDERAGVEVRRRSAFGGGCGGG